MSKNNNRSYLNFSSFVMRSPLFPLDFIHQLTAGQDISAEKLTEVYQNPVVDEAIFLASPDLYNQMHEWLQGNLKDHKKVDRLHYSLMRYILRMSTRSTPFGLFAGFCVGSWRDRTQVEMPSQEQYTRHTRLDMNYLCALAQDLAKHPVIKGKLKYFPNSSIYPVGEQLRYVEYRYRNARRTHHIVAVDYSEYLADILSAAAGGAYLHQLAALLEDPENDISLEEAAEFIDELIDSQLLVNELEPAITGPEFLDQILTVLENIRTKHPDEAAIVPNLESGILSLNQICETIIKTRNTLLELDSKKIGATVSYYHRIAEELKPLQTTFELKFLFQTDMVKTEDAEHCLLDDRILESVYAGLDVLNKMSPAPSKTNMAQFREAFYERYETREIPLLQALDTESGVGYLQTGNGAGDIAPLVDDLAIPGGSGEGSTEIRWNRIQSMLLKKYQDALINDLYQIELTDKDLEPFKSVWTDLPDTLASMVKIVDRGDEENPPLIFMSGSGGSSAGNLLGRFCHSDKATDTFVREITAQEAELHPEQILAEIIHLPESRVGNVLLRPVLRDYEIPYLAKPAVAEEFQIKLEDLMVSADTNRVKLRSKRFNKEIIPHLTNAHNFSYNALPIYHFLADIQTQGIRSGIGFNWGALANEFPFQPRAVYHNVIFSPAAWNITKEEIEELTNKEDDPQLLELMTAWRKTRKMPAQVALMDSDNQLFINLDNIMCIKTLFSVTRNRPNFQIIEYLFDTGSGDRAVVKSDGHYYSNEFVFCFYKDKISESDTPEADPEGNNSEH